MIDMSAEAYLLIYIAIISFFSIIITVYDKAAAKTGRRRISERMLMLTGFFGGATAMYGTMQFIRHKTKHKKFMLGLPIFILLHLAITVYIIYL